jgi:hypothetical protein
VLIAISAQVAPNAAPSLRPSDEAILWRNMFLALMLASIGRLLLFRVQTVSASIEVMAPLDAIMTTPITMGLERKVMNLDIFATPL